MANPIEFLRVWEVGSQHCEGWDFFSEVIKALIIFNLYTQRHWLSFLTNPQSIYQELEQIQSTCS